MAAKYFVVLALAAVASALPVVTIAKYAYAEPEAPAYYGFQYSVHDDHSGDVKQQQESLAGDSLVQPDGVQRIVECSFDAEHGFNANVRYEEHPIQAPVPAKIAYVAPLAKIAYAAPVAKLAYSAPVYHDTKVAYPAPLDQVSYSSPAIFYHH